MLTNEPTVAKPTTAFRSIIRCGWPEPCSALHASTSFALLISTPMTMAFDSSVATVTSISSLFEPN